MVRLEKLSISCWSLLVEWAVSRRACVVVLPVYYYIISVLLLIIGDPCCHGNWGTWVDVVKIKGLAPKEISMQFLLCLI